LIQRPRLEQLETFALVVELGSFSAAAERLELTQPAVSTQVRQLEKRLGLRLLERVGRRAAPTAAGRELLAHVRTISASVGAAMEALTRHSTGVMGRVRIGTGATACIYFLPQILHDLRVQFPSLEIIVRTGNTADMLKALEENSLDLGLVTLPATGRIFDVRPVLADEFVAIVSPGAAKLPAKVTPAVLATLPVVVYESGSNTRTIVDTWFARAGLPLKPAMELESVEAIKQLVGAGLGCAIVPRMAVSKASATSPFVVRSLTPKVQRTLALVMRRDKPLHRGLKEVADAIAKYRTLPRGT
jgi:DNA-binding transcriptional LysR family regulator